ncbi:hypothetical protein [Chryseobacterium cheonjiense]|uniref:Uncharacterized protein n=1 Tax=Chryseobacterium cheonjiense TaxID=2728845 RepID=A0A7Y0FHU2_9FLAO|nr:hypothetical protein [Chryseobacterium cheonjiense]NML56783.1 hypothetical protein [Chryseobacterium cheonjiense]
MKTYLLPFVLCFYGVFDAQFNNIYPIGDQINIGYKSSMVPNREKILFEANPIVRLPIYNNIKSKLESGKPKASTLYLNFNPTIRMYDDNSKPVKTPSYKISLGFQNIIRLKPFKNIENHFLTYSIESGHYSNGQSKCIFDKNLDDGGADCNKAYSFITNDSKLSDIINRESGNFSTNFSEVALNYRVVSLGEDYRPSESISLLIKYNRFHNDLLWIIPDIGGYTPEDIKIYGKNRYNFGFTYIKRFSDQNFLKEKLKLNHWTTSVNYELISKPHKSVNPSRLELNATAYFENNLGIFINGIFGHDDYNYRFVDSGSQIFLGLTYDIFPPVEMNLRLKK